MALIVISPQFVGQVWPTVGPMLQRAVDLSPEEGSLDQLELLIRQGRVHLLVWQAEDGEVAGAATVEFQDTPKHRIAHVGYMAGSGVVRAHVFDEAKAWMRNCGATIAQCWTKGTLVQMYEKMGMTNTHQVMRIGL